MPYRKHFLLSNLFSFLIISSIAQGIQQYTEPYTHSFSYSTSFLQFLQVIFFIFLTAPNLAGPYPTQPIQAKPAVRCDTVPDDYDFPRRTKPDSTIPDSAEPSSTLPFDYYFLTSPGTTIHNRTMPDISKPKKYDISLPCRSGLYTA
jgi:hypothetical protein